MDKLIIEGADLETLKRYMDQRAHYVERWRESGERWESSKDETAAQEMEQSIKAYEKIQNSIAALLYSVMKDQGMEPVS